MLTKPKVAIIIPTANREDVLARAIDSSLAQDYGDVQVIVVDDASNDKTQSLLERYEGASNFSYVILEPPMSGTASTGRNLGLALTDADYISFLDSDDELDPRKVRMQIEAMREDEQKLTPFPLDLSNLTPYRTHSEIDFCLSQMYFITAQGEKSIKGNIVDCFFATHPNIVMPNIEQLSGSNLTTGIFRKQLFHLLGGFKLMRLGEDSEFKERIISFGCNVSFVYEPLYLYYRGAPNSLMGTIDRSDTEENRIRREKSYMQLAKTRHERKFCSSESEYIEKFREPINLDTVSIAKVYNLEQLKFNADLPMTEKTKSLLTNLFKPSA